MDRKQLLGLLKKGVNYWNKWRKENPEVEIDLSGVNFSDIKPKPHIKKVPTINSKSFNLRGVNFSYVNLNRVNFRAVNLSKANLSYAKLNKADLREVNLSEANLSHTDLTGACIQDWLINGKTQFDHVVCEYIYLEKHFSGPLIERRPHDIKKTFAPGDFIRLIEKARDTLDLIFSQGIDWAAFYQTFQGLQVQTGSDKLFIQAIEKKRDGSFVVKVNTPPTADKAALEKEFWARYQPLLEAKEAEYRALLQEKEIEHQQQRIQDFQHHNTNITEIVKMLGNRTINVEAKAVTGDNINQKGNFVAGVQKGGTIQGTVQIIENLNDKETFAEIAVDIQQLLAQLETQGFSPQGAKNKVATDLATQANENPEFKNKLAQWGKYVADAAANGMIGSGVVEVIKLALGFLV